MFKFRVILNKITDVLGTASAYSILVLALIINYEIFMRYFLGDPTIWVTEISEFLMGFMTFMAVAYTLKEDGHITIDLVTSRFSPKTRRIMYFPITIMIIVYATILTWQSFLMWWEALRFNWTTWGILKVPLKVPYFFFLMGMIILCLQQLNKTYTVITKK